MANNLCKVIGFISGAIGIYFITWEIINGQFDEFFVYGLIACAIAALLFFQGFRKHDHTEDTVLPTRPHCANHEQNDSIGFCEVCKKPFCEECLSEVYGKYYCASCKESFLQKISQIPLKSKTVAVLLCLILGLIGIHRIYLGHQSGAAILIFHVVFLPATLLFYIPIVVYLPVSIILSIVALVDLFKIAVSNMTDNYGRDLV